MGLRIYTDKIRPHIVAALPYYPLGLPDMTDEVSPISIGMRSPQSNFIAVWRLQGDEKIHLPKADPKMRVLYPTDLGIRLEVVAGGLNVIFPRKMMACILSQEW